MKYNATKLQQQLYELVVVKKLSAAHCAKVLQISETTVRCHLNRMGIKPKAKQSSFQQRCRLARNDKLRYQTYLDLYKQGCSYEEIGRRCGVSRQTVYCVLRSNPDFVPRPRGGNHTAKANPNLRLSLLPSAKKAQKKRRFG